jgi:CRISPR/Cas system-associated exonuclease Cas4 (RecB family)
MGLLPENFQFTQSSLQDYLDCPRRFQLRYILGQLWPAVPGEPLLEHERYTELGRRFHQLIEQHIAGLPVEMLTASINAPDLARWWRNYLNTPPHDVLSLPMRRAEAVFSTPLAGYRLAARYDLLAIQPGQRAVIVDWKTERKRPLRTHLAARMQTRVYRLVLVEAGHALNGNQPLEPEQVEMLYWFAEFPTEPELLPYNAGQHASDIDYVSSLIAEIAAKRDDVFLLTADTTRCRFCVYRSLCERGVAAGADEVGTEETEPELGIDWNDIEEIAY